MVFSKHIKQMKNLKNIVMSLAGSALAFVALAVPAYAQYTPTPLDEEGAVTVVTDSVGTVSNVLGGTLPTIFGLLAIMVGFFFIWRQVQKRIGRAK